MADILILKGAREPTRSTAYRTWRTLRQVGSDEYFLESYSDVVFRIQKGVVSCFIYDTGRDLASYDLVYIRDFQGFEHERNAIAYYLDLRNRHFINEDVRQFQHISKLTQAMAFASKGLPVIDMVYADFENITELADDFLYPAVLKSIVGGNGQDNVLVYRPDQVVESSVPQAMLQPFISNDCDYRIVTADEDILMAYKRLRTSKDEHRNNIALGARREFLTSVPNEVSGLAITAAKSLGRNLAGVDIIQDKETGQYYVLEVNLNYGTPDIADHEAVGHYYRRLAAYLHSKATNS